MYRYRIENFVSINTSLPNLLVTALPEVDKNGVTAVYLKLSINLLSHSKYFSTGTAFLPRLNTCIFLIVYLLMNFEL